MDVLLQVVLPRDRLALEAMGPAIRVGDDDGHGNMVDRPLFELREVRPAKWKMRERPLLSGAFPYTTQIPAAEDEPSAAVELRARSRCRGLRVQSSATWGTRREVRIVRTNRAFRGDEATR